MDIGELMVRVGADTTALGARLEEADKSVERFSASARTNFARMGDDFSRLFTSVVKRDVKGMAFLLGQLITAASASQGMTRGGTFVPAQSLSAGLIAGGAGLLSVLSSLFSGGRAVGGSVVGNGSVLVGEKRPEIFTPRMSGTITPNHLMHNGTAGITLNMTVVTPDASSFRASQGQILAEAAGSLKRAQRNL